MRLIRSFWQKFFQNKLIAGSAVLFTGNILASFGHYLYHLLMGRMLGPADYGILASLISLSYLLTIPVGSLGLVIVKYVSAWRGRGESEMIVNFYSWLNRKLLFFSLVGLFFLTIILPLLADFLHLDSTWPVFLIVISSLVGIYLAVNTAIFQGFLRFGLMSILGIIQAVLKLSMGVLLVYLGWRVLGGVWAVLIGSLLACLLAVFLVRRLLTKVKGKRKKVESRSMIKYAVPVFFATLAFTSLYTTDIVLARHFLSAQEAGFYASLATLGKIIFFASNPIAMVMFPMISEHHANGKKYVDLLGLSFGLVFLTCLGISGIYFLFPQLMVEILFGRQYLPAASYLFLFAIFLSLYSLTSLLINFYLSVKKVKIVVLPVTAAVVQAVLISFLHQSVSQVVAVSIGVLGLLLAVLLVYFFLDYGQNQKTISLRHHSCL